MLPATSTAASTRRTLSKAVTGVSSSSDAGTRGADGVVRRPAAVDANVAERQVAPVRGVLDVGVEGAVEPSVDAVLVGERGLGRQLEDELPGVGQARAAVGDGAAVDPHDVAGAYLHDLHPAPVRVCVALDALSGIAAAVVRRGELGERRRPGASLGAAGQPLPRLTQLDLVAADHDRAVVTEVLHPVVQPDRHVVQLAGAVGHRAAGLTDEAGGRNGGVVLRVVVVLRSSGTLVERAVAVVPAFEGPTVEDGRRPTRVYRGRFRDLRACAVDVEVGDLDRPATGRGHGEEERGRSAGHLAGDRPGLELPAVGPAVVGLVGVDRVVVDVDRADDGRTVGSCRTELDERRRDVRFRQHGADAQRDGVDAAQVDPAERKHVACAHLDRAVPLATTGVPDGRSDDLRRTGRGTAVLELYAPVAQRHPVVPGDECDVDRVAGVPTAAANRTFGGNGDDARARPGAEKVRDRHRDRTTNGCTVRARYRYADTLIGAAVALEAVLDLVAEVDRPPAAWADEPGVADRRREHRRRGRQRHRDRSDEDRSHPPSGTCGHPVPWVERCPWGTARGLAGQSSTWDAAPPP